MFNWLLGLFADTAIDTAIYSADLASACGMHQMAEPDGLQKLAAECKNNKENN